MRLNTNMSALNTYGKLNKNNKMAEVSFEKLSSGLRINRAADDSAGLSISQKMKAQIRGLRQAQDNIEQGIDLVKTAEGGMAKILDPHLQRARELTIQAANGTLSSDDRQKIQDEINQIIKGIDDIACNTEFNTIKLLTGGRGVGQVQGPGNSPTFTNALAVPPVGADGRFAFRTNEGYSTTSADDSQILVYGSGSTSNPSVRIGNSTYYLHHHSSNPVGSTVNVTPTAESGGVYSTVYNIVDAANNVNVSVTQMVQVVQDKYEIRYQTRNNSGVPHNIGVMFHMDTKLGTDDYAPFIVNGGQVNTSTAYNGGGLPSSFTVYNNNGSNPELQVQGVLQTTDGFVVLENPSKFWIGRYNEVHNWNWSPSGGSYGDSGFSVVWNQRSVNAGSAFTVNTFYGLSVPPTLQPVGDQSSTGDLKLQVGANSGDLLRIALEDMTAEGLGVSTLRVDTTSNAQATLAKVDAAIQQVSSGRAKFGVYENALEHVRSNVTNAFLNLTAAESRISDVDMAKEMMQLTKAQLLGQSSQAMLAHANELSQSMVKSALSFNA